MTSHCLIHATKHPLGFKIMKEIMRKRGRSDSGTNNLTFEQASITGTYWIFDLKIENIKNKILSALKDGPKNVNLFYHDWVQTPSDMFCQADYRNALLDLEKENKIEVLDKDGRSPKPASARRKQTLGEGYFVRIVRPLQ